MSSFFLTSNWQGNKASYVRSLYKLLGLFLSSNLMAHLDALHVFAEHGKLWPWPSAAQPADLKGKPCWTETTSPDYIYI